MIRKSAFIFVILVISVVNSYSNWGGGSSGTLNTGIFSAMGTDSVQMVDELLTITLHPNYVHVRVEYSLNNAGTAVKVRAGFPFQTLNKDDIRDYKIIVDSAEIPWKFVAGEMAKWENDYGLVFPDNETDTFMVCWYVSEVSFASMEQKKVIIEYESSYTTGSGGPSDTDYHYPDTYTYILHTGATWKGPIWHGVVKIKPVNIKLSKLKVPGQFRWDDYNQEYTWLFDNLEPKPKDNIDISLGNSYTTTGVENGLYYEEDENKYFDFWDFDSLSASSHLGNKEEYSPQILKKRRFDEGEKKGTAWVEGKPGNGVGESITITLKEPRKVNQIGIIPGFDKSKKLYYANNRISDVEVILNGKSRYTKHFFDENVIQWVNFGDIVEMVHTIKVIIKGVYKGSKYDDTAISEIVLRQQLSHDAQVRRSR